MTTINAQTIINEVMQAHAIAPTKQGEYRNEYACFWPKFAPWGFEDLNEPDGYYKSSSGSAHSALIYDLMTEATSEINDLCMVANKIKFQTSAKGFHTVTNTRENLQRFADLVRKNATAFGGGIIRTAKPKAAISWPANLISLFKQSIEDQDYQAALDTGDKLGALFFATKKGVVMMQVAPVPCDFEPRVVSVCNENGEFEVIYPATMQALSGQSYTNKRSRNAQVENVKADLAFRKSFNLSEALDKLTAAPVDQAALRNQWMIEHGLAVESIEADAEELKPLGQRFDEERAKRKAAREASAAQDVAQVVADAVAAIAISEARELATCEAGENEAQAKSIGNTTSHTPAWSAMAEYVPCSPIKTGFGDSPKPAFSGGFEGENDKNVPDTPPMESGATPTPRPVESVSYLSDIPLSLAVSAYSGTSFSPDRRGQSAQKEYSQSMAADYETMKAQAIKGGTLALLSEVFARYRGRQSSAYKAYLASSSRCVSSFIAGPANFPAARMNKRADISHKRLTEYLDGGKMALQAACRTLRPDLRAIMAGDADAIDRLTVKIANAERLQATMKDANKAIRTNAKKGEAHQVAALMEIGFSERQATEVVKPDYCGRVGFQPYSLTNNNANIRRMKERLEQISKAQACEVVSVECSNGVTLEDDAPANRVRLYFPGKPSEEIRAELKSNGFRWAPSVGAWQAYRNYGTLATAKRIAGEPVTDNEPAPALIEPTPPAVESQQVAMAPSVETDVKQSHDAPIAHQINESGAWTSERCEAALNAQDRPTVQSKSGKWCAWLFINGLGLYGMGFEVIGSGLNKISSYPTASDRMKALQAMARAADAPTDTTTDGQKRTESTGITPTTPVAVSSAASTTPPAVSSAHPRNIIPANGLHIVDDAFEAWTFPHKDRFGFVMYLGKSAKPWKYYGYPTEAKRDAGFERCATEARDIAASKAKTKAETKARINAGHGLQVGDVVRSSWGYDQTNVSHYQIVNIIGKRTVEVRKLAEHDDATGSMSGRCSPVWGEFVGDVKRCMVDQFGSVNVMGRDFGRASKIEPLTVVHGVRCYAASYCSTYA